MAKRDTRKHRIDLPDEGIDGRGSTILPFPAKRSKARKAAAGYQTVPEMEHAPRQSAKHKAPLVPKNKAQANYKQKIESSTITIGTGPAGTGKSYVAMKIAAKMIDDGDLDRIIVSRPSVGVDEDIGTLPGTENEKTQPWFQPLLEILQEHWGCSHVENMIKNKKIMFVPLSYMRGRTFNNAFILVDEAQNTTIRQMNALLTRLGQYSKIVVDGDVEQIDIQKPSGLVDAIRRFQDIPEIAFAQFEVKDIVRHELIKKIILAYRQALPAE